MTTPIDLNGIMPMQWIFAVDPNYQLNTSQRLNIKHGQRTVDSTFTATVEPGVYMLSWDTNMPDPQWKSFYFRDYSNYQVFFTNPGSLNPSGMQRVVVPKKSFLTCHVSLQTQTNTIEPVVAVTLIPTAPLANVFET